MEEKIPVESLLRRALVTWGTASQILMAAEECSELAVACLHYNRGNYINRARPGTSDDELAEELVDVELVCAQLRLMPGMGARVDHYTGIKLKRLKELLDAEEGGGNGKQSG